MVGVPDLDSEMVDTAAQASSIPRAAASGLQRVALLSSDIWLKSNRTRTRMIRIVRANLEAALGDRGTVGYHPGHRLGIGSTAPDAVDRVARVFGVASVEILDPLPFGAPEQLADEIAARFADAVPGRTFAVRTRRRGTHDWRSYDLNCMVGDRLVAAGGTVDLTDPQLLIEPRIGPQDAAVVIDRVAGPGGLPIGSQERVLALLSGGLDSPVAAWMMMSRGCGTDILHFVLDCAQTDHALSVAYRLWESWGFGDQPTVHVVDFRDVADDLRAEVPAKMRQVVLKALMLRAAAAVGREEHHPALVTGDSLGQVSSQTLTHLAALSAQSPLPVLRPLLGLDKREILRRAREIGSYDLSSRAKEVCDLSDGGPVETAATRGRLLAGVKSVGDRAWLEAVAGRDRLPLADWMPGSLDYT
jgi:thiamine biosynthesis protein ThiI